MSELIKISKEFKGIIGGVWLGIETTVLEGEDVIEKFKEKNELLEKAYMSMNPQINWMNDGVVRMTTTDFSPTKDERISSFIATINMCSSKKFLENFRTRVSEENNLELTEAFNNKLKTFE